MKLLLIDNSYPINTREMRIINTIKKAKLNIKICAWNRSNRVIKECDNYIYSDKSGYGNKLKKLYGLIGYFFFIKKVIRDYNPEIIIAAFWDMLFIASLLKKKNQVLIYENLDMPSSKNKILYKVVLFIEKIALKNTDKLILASRFFEDLYKNKIPKIVYENYPSQDIVLREATGEIKNWIEENNLNKNPIVAFVGNIRYYSLMIRLIESLKNKEITLLFFGSGPDEEKLKKYCEFNNHKDVRFYGKYDYFQIKEIYENIDYIWAVYPSDDQNVIYAISNKFHESILFKKTTIFSKNTKLGEYVEKEQVGLVINERSPDEFNNLFNLINDTKKDSMVEKIERYYLKNSYFWEDKENELIEFIKND